jgi:hypothetical protein
MWICRLPESERLSDERAARGKSECGSARSALTAEGAFLV